jgi:uncharacterized protein
MTSSVFCRYDLRTTDPDAARIFYAEVVGLDFTEAPPSTEPSPIGVWLLHEQARARGARPHWLGHIGVTDIEATVARLVEGGSERLGPTVQAQDGSRWSTLRDPLGALVAMRHSGQRPNRTPVGWHHLHTSDLERSWTTYSERFGWKQTETLDVPEPAGGYRLFAWDEAGQSVGSMANSARAPGVHPHWLFYFSVADLEAALAKTRAHGGNAPASATVLANGDRLAPCEDGQGAAFGLYQSSARR